MNIILRALLIGSKSVILFYVAFSALGLLGALVLGLINGFLGPVLAFAKNRSKHKIALCFLGAAMTVLMFCATLPGLPHWLIDYFIYGEGGGGLEPGGKWFVIAFIVYLGFFFGSSFLFGLPLGFLFVYDKQLGGSTT